MTQTPVEYTALNFDGTERRANYRTVAYRIDILHLCDGKDAAAILWEVIYRWQTEYRKPEIEKEIERRKKNNAPPLTEEEVDNLMWVWMSYNDFVRETGGAVTYNTVIRMLDYLVETVHLMECRENHDPRYPDYEYRIRMDVVKDKLKALPAAPTFIPKVPKKKEKKSEVSTHLGTPEKRSTQKGRRALKSTQVGTASTQTGIASTQDGREVYPNRGTSHNYSHTSHIQHTEESTSPQPGSQLDESGSGEPTRTHTQDDTKSVSTSQPASQASAAPFKGASGLQVGQDKPSENDTRSQLSTLMASSPQRGAKVSSRPSAFVAAPLFGTQKPARPQLTEEGKNVLEWYQIIQACKVRKTDANINACNGLGEEDGMSFDNLKKAIEHWEAHSYVKERQIPIDLQKLEDPKGAFTFAKAMLVIRAKPKQGSTSPPTTNKPTVSGRQRLDAVSL